MTVWRWTGAALGLAVLVACQPVTPTAGVSVGSGGVGAGVGVESGRINAGVGTGGPAASVDVVQTDKVDVSVGTGGAGVSVHPGGGPLRIGYGRGGFRLGI
jgi:hypothetical protein